MLQLGGEFNFLEEPFRAKRRSELGAEHFDGHLPAQLDVLGEIDGGHPTGTEFPLDPVSISQCGGQAIKLVRHERIINIES